MALEMEKAVASKGQDSLERSAIRQRMEEVRSDLDQDVQEIVEGARDLRDWRTYVRSYPWACVSAALAVGYLIVPRRSRLSQPTAEMLAELAKQSRLAAMADLPTKSNGGRVLAFVGSLALRGVASYVSQQAGKYFTPPVAKPKQDDQP
jgi:hypothetical protein